MIRTLDIVLSFIALIILLPFCLIISVFLVIDSPGTVLFRQKRIGKNEKEFTILKLRTMVNDPKNSSLLTSTGDSRITKTGSFLRKWKMDEIPQLINVLKGDMSIVGPRPEVPKYVKYYSQTQKVVLRVKPGITDYASIEFSNEESILSLAEDPEKLYIEDILPKKIDLNKKYINDKSVKNYFKIIFLTVKKLIK